MTLVPFDLDTCKEGGRERERGGEREGEREGGERASHLN